VIEQSLNTNTASSGKRLYSLSKKELKDYQKGQHLYLNSAACAGCHGPKGLGVDNLAPPLIPSDWVSGNKERLIKVVLYGLQGPITVNSIQYDLPTIMPGIAQRKDLSNDDIANLLNYLRIQNNPQKKPSLITPEEITSIKAQTNHQNQLPYRQEELAK